jgi:HK97 family phage prohead protease
MSKKTFVLSDGTKKNTHGFILDLNGLDMVRFKANPVMLFSHDRGNVIGRWENVRLEDGRLLGDADFDMDDEAGARVAKKVEKGYLKGASLGIIIKKIIESVAGTTVAQAEVLEASIVAVPSDAGAVVLYDDEQNIVNLEAVKNILNNISKQKKMDENKVTELTAQVTALTADVASRDARIAELEAKVNTFEKQRVETLVNNAIAAKKIGADEKDAYTALAAKDYEAVEKILSKMQGVAGRVVTQLEAGKTTTTLSWDELDKAGKLAALKADNPEEYRRLYNERFGVNY